MSRDDHHSHGFPHMANGLVLALTIAEIEVGPAEVRLKDFVNTADFD